MEALLDLYKCGSCKELKPKTDYHKDAKSGSRGCAWYCKACANLKGREFHEKHKNDPAYKREKADISRRVVYGITQDEYEGRLKKQAFKCAICDKDLKLGDSNTHLDHIHKTNQLREFLCTNCNRGLGHFQENPVLLYKAVDYLEKHKC